MLRHIIALSFTIAFSFILSHSQLEEMLMDVSLIPVFVSSGCSWSIGRRSYLVTLKSQHPQFGSVQLLGIQRYGWWFRNAAHQLIWRISMNIPLFTGLYTCQVVSRISPINSITMDHHGSQVLSICIHLVFMALAKSGTPTLVGQKLGTPLAWHELRDKGWRWKQPTFEGIVQWLRCCFRLSSSVYIGASMHLGEIEMDMLHDCFTHVFSSRLHPDLFSNWTAQLFVQLLYWNVTTEVDSYFWGISNGIGHQASWSDEKFLQGAANRWIFTTVSQLVGSTPNRGVQWQISNIHRIHGTVIFTYIDPIKINHSCR